MERLFKHKDFWNDFFLRTVHDNNLLFKIFYKFYRIYRPSGLVINTKVWKAISQPIFDLQRPVTPQNFPHTISFQDLGVSDPKNCLIMAIIVITCT